MKLISRFTSNEALDFEFKLPEDGLRNRQTLFVSQVAINFTAAPTTAGDVQIYISDDEGEDHDLGIRGNGGSQHTCVLFTDTSPVPIPKGSKLILRYANADSVEVTARFLWRV